MKKNVSSSAAIAIGLVLFFGLNLLANRGLRNLRIDLTEESLYTLSEGSKNIVADLDEPIRLYLYFATEVASQYPDIKAYGNRVREMLEEFELASNGNLLVEVIDPEPFSEEEDRAVEEGIAGVRPRGTSDAIYLGLVATNSTDDREVIPFLVPSKERFLEYDISKVLYTLANPAERVVAVITSLPMGGSPGMQMMGQPPTPKWQVLSQIESFFKVRMLGTDVEEIEEDVDVLMVVHPKNLPDSTLYAIDQYVLGGGHSLVFVDPYCGEDQSGVDPSNPMSAMQAPRNSNLEPLFEKWGVELVNNKLLGDRENAYRVNVGTPMQPEEIGYVVWNVLDGEAFSEEDAVTSVLNRVFLPTAGILKKRPGARTEVIPLIQSSEDSMQVDVGSIQFGPDPKRLLNSFVAEYERFTVAARISGDVESAFPDGKPDDLDPETLDPVGPDVPEALQAPDAADANHLASSTSPINVIVVADCDMLADRYWINEIRVGNLTLGYDKQFDNGDLALNAVENLSGGEDLISIRARGSFTRPFTKIEELQKESDERYRAEEQELEAALAETQRRITELQREKAPGESSAILSPQQVEELERYRDEKIETRKKLRDVKHNLNKDIEALQTRIKWINIATLPLLVCLFALVLGFIRRRQPSQR